ncbi:MAG TPA: response regulator [Gemmatimonadaceae bacterium]|nr:response regulator [Gemmatimonadaceae bacterium]
MHDSEMPIRPPMVLIANDQEWSARSLESILGPSGYAVLRAYTGRQALELARSTQPDLVILDERMPDVRGMEVCRMLREDPRFGDHTPVLLTTADSADRAQMLAAYEAGAWEFVTLPFDSAALLLRIGTYVRAKREVDRVRDQSLLDELTGLYNMRGLARRARELGADAFRHRHALACVAIAPEAEAPFGSGAPVEPSDRESDRVVEHLGRVVRRVGRVSDVVGRLGYSELAIIAPTEPSGVVRLVERIQEAADQTPLEIDGAPRQLRIRAGYYAVPDYAESSVDAVEMLLRAASALRHARSAGADDRPRAFDEIPLPLATR